MGRRELLLSFSLIVLVTINIIPCGAPSTVQTKQDEVNGIRLILHGMKQQLTWELLNSTGVVTGYRVTWQDDSGEQNIAKMNISDRKVLLKKLTGLICSNSSNVTISPYNLQNKFVGSAATKILSWQGVVTNVTLMQYDGMIIPSWSVACKSDTLHQFSVTLRRYADLVSQIIVTANTSSSSYIVSFSPARPVSCGRYNVTIQPQDATSMALGVPAVMPVYFVSVSSLVLTPNVSMISASWSMTHTLSLPLQFDVTWRSEDVQDEQTCVIHSHASSYYNTDVCNNITLHSCTRYNVTIKPYYMREENHIGIPTTSLSHTLPRNLSLSHLVNSSLGPTSVTLTWGGPEPSCPVTYVISYSGTAMRGENKTSNGKVRVEEDGKGGWSGINNAHVSVHIEADDDINVQNKSNNSTSDVKAHITNLIPFSSYNVCVAAEVLTEIVSNNCIVFNTTEAKPSIPEFLLVAPANDSHLNLTWEEPSQMNGKLTNYTVRWSNDSTLLGEWKTTSTWYLLKCLEPFEDYSITVTASTGGGEGEEARINGTMGYDCSSPSTTTTTQEINLINIKNEASSTPTTLSIITASSPAKSSSSPEEDSSKSPLSALKTLVIVVGVLAGCLLMAAAGAVVYKRKIIQETVRRHLRRRSESNESYYDVLQRKIEDKVQQLGNPSTLEFEFDQLTIESYDGTTDVGRKRENARKNLFTDVLPFDNHRVRLARKEAGKTDYINASFVASSSVPEASFIACQGPIEGTVTDFWWMVWEQSVSTVVMLEKCSPYWPSPPASQGNFGPFSVEVEKVIARSNYVLREITLKKGEESRELLQFHLNEWPEFHVSRSERELLRLLRGVRAQQTTARNVVVHCSSGTGKTGTFIALWQLTLAAERRLPNIDVKQTVLDMRQYRPLLVQDEEQYLYLHFSLLEYLRSTNTFRELARSRGGAQTAGEGEDQQCDRILLPAPVDDFTVWTGYVTVDDSPPQPSAHRLSGYRSQGAHGEEVEMMPMNTASSTE